MKRKWFIGILILVVVGAVLAVVFVNMFTNKSTSLMAEKLNNASSAGYLYTESEEYKTINDYFENVSNALSAESDSQENVVVNYKNLYLSFSREADFLNKQLAFMEYTNIYKNSNKNIEKLLKNAQKSANNAKNYILSAKNLTNPSQYWTAGTWYECKDTITAMIKDTNKALKLVANVYKAGVSSKLLNNKLSSLVFETAGDLSDEVLTNIETADAANKIYNFTHIYFSETGLEKIMSYQYDLSIKEKIETILNSENRSELAAYQEFLEGNLN